MARCREATERRGPTLLTPGPLSTAPAVRAAMQRDYGSWDDDFQAMTLELRQRVLSLIGDRHDAFTCVPMQGSGSFVVEAMLGTLLAASSRSLVLVNGAYGRRIVRTLEYLHRDHVIIDKGDYQAPRAAELAAALAADPSISHVLAVHCETSSGILNPIEEIADVVRAAGRRLLIDAMSSFGAIDIDADTLHFDALVSSANKCIEGVPGFGFVIARKAVLESCEGQSHSLSLDVHDQWTHMNRTGQWRFTPPTHAVAAFLEAMARHAAEGGVPARGRRYQNNRDVLVDGMRKLGFETLLSDRWLSPIIVTFFSPADSAFDFGSFYGAMKRRGFIIYPGKLTVVDSFRVGCIGHIDAGVMRKAVAATKAALKELGVVNARPSPLAYAEREKLIAPS